MAAAYPTFKIQRVIFQPMSLLVAELFKTGVKLRAACRLEMTPGSLEQSPLERDYRSIIHRGPRKQRRRAFAFLQQFFFDKPVRADQESVAGERR